MYASKRPETKCDPRSGLGITGNVPSVYVLAPRIATCPGIYHCSLFPFDSINAYVIGDALIDANIRYSKRRLLCALGVSLWRSAADVPAMESGRERQQYTEPSHWIVRFPHQLRAGQVRSVECVLRAGDTVAGFEVMEPPGHGPGHMAFYRESNGTLLFGDVLLQMDLLTMRTGLQEPPVLFTPDAGQK
jgi:hypothetical protein